MKNSRTQDEKLYEVYLQERQWNYISWEEWLAMYKIKNEKYFEKSVDKSENM